MKKIFALLLLATPAFAVPHAYVIEGLWSDYFQIEPALHHAGLSSTRITVNELGKDDPTGQSVIVLGNVDINHLQAPRLARIKEFVANGGGLVVLGGECAFSRGGYTNTPLAEILPVHFPFSHLIPHAAPGLTRAPSATWLPAFSGSASAFYAHTLVPKPGAVVQLLAGGKPAIISGNYGNGRAVAVGLTTNGEGPAAFWHWPEWPKVLGQAIDWAAGDFRPAPPTGFPVLASDELNDFALGLKTPRDFLARAQAHPNTEVAQALFAHVTAGDEKIPLAKALPVLLPHAKPDWGAKLVERVEAFNPNRDDRNAALVLLGATRSPAALPRLLEALGKPETKSAALEGLGRTGDSKAIPAVKTAYDQALRAACLPGETEWFRPEEFAREQAVPATEAALALYRLGDPSGLESVLAMNRRVQFYFRVFSNAGRRELRNWADPTGLAILKGFYACSDGLAPALHSLKRHDSPIPANQITAFLKIAQQTTDFAEADWLAAEIAASARAFPPATWQPLASAKDGLIARSARAAAENNP